MFKRGILVNFIILGVGLAVSMDLIAQATLEEVLVTARKRAESLQDVPISVAAFTAAGSKFPPSLLKSVMSTSLSPSTSPANA